ncbi:hypothetical protein CUU65_13070 [Bacillus safensis]|nr:hypothetical protein [Bacillus sp. 8A6]PLT36260.1 hypothetical protein CUU65_13070 [Bacillus safensis]RAU58157.1 hypothetical protein BSAJGB5T_14050 [Bacillus safensis]RKE75918.1 hypothetical protein DFO75_0158 [Bacillus safensis]
MHKFSSVVCVFMKIVGAYIDFAKRNHHLHNEKRMKHKGVMNFEKKCSSYAERTQSCHETIWRSYH